MADNSKPEPAPEAEHADGVRGSAKADKVAERIERANITPVDQGCGVAEKDKKL